MKKRWLLIIYIFSFLGIFSCQKACQKEISIEPISVVISTPIETLDPRLATSASASRASNLVFATLFIVGSDLNPVPYLSEKYERIDDKTYHITLKKNLFFHDNSPLIAKDVVYTFSSLSSKDVLSPHAEKLSYVESINSIDDHTIVFKLKEPFAPFLTDLCGIGIVSKKNCENRSEECQHEHIGSGPFKVKSWDRAKETLLLTPFEKFALGISKSPISIRVVRDENTRGLELLNGKAEIIDGEISITKALELKDKENLEVKDLPGLGFTYLAMNMKNETLSHQKVRKAISLAIDYDKVIEKVLSNKAKRASGLIPSSHWAKNENLTAPAYNPNEAKLLLKDFKNLKLSIATSQNKTFQNIAMLFADYLKQVGIETSVRVKDWSALYEDMQNGQFEMFIATWVPVTEPNLYEWVHHSKNIPSEEKGGGNRHAYKNTQVDKLIDQAKAISDKEKRKELYTKIEEILSQDLPYIPLWNENRIVVVNKNIKGYEPRSTGSLLGLINAYREKN